jgi:MoaA/NifB/PqqE/SkfB family radical SAM enzyme
VSAPVPVRPGPDRVVLNFSHRCALACEWCYVPFVSPPARAEVVLQIVERVQTLGFRSVTFGGGDPFQYAFIETVLRRAKDLNLFVHVDTHAKGLRPSQEMANLVSSCVDLLGLPLDGPTAEVHDDMRSAFGHFSLLRRRLEWLKSTAVHLKINTVVSARNATTLPELAQLVASIRPRRWSLYQYWPLGPGGAVNSKHHLDDALFRELSSQAAAIVAGSTTVVEINSRESRRATYPIIHHDGTTFVHSRAPQEALQLVGSIFDDQVRDVIEELCGPERPIAASRYDPWSRSG